MVLISPGSSRRKKGASAREAVRLSSEFYQTHYTLQWTKTQDKFPFFNRLTSDATQWRTEIGWPIFQTVGH